MCSFLINSYEVTIVKLNDTVPLNYHHLSRWKSLPQNNPSLVLNVVGWPHSSLVFFVCVIVKDRIWPSTLKKSLVILGQSFDDIVNGHHQLSMSTNLCKVVRMLIGLGLYLYTSNLPFSGSSWPKKSRTNPVQQNIRARDTISPSWNPSFW